LGSLPQLSYRADEPRHSASVTPIPGPEAR
jgi:hypothetical protein